jgi:hypothetical protein
VTRSTVWLDRTTTRERGTTVSLEFNKRLATNWLVWIGEKNVDAMLATTAPDWRMHGGPPALPSGPIGVRALGAHLDDVQQTWAVDDVIAEGDMVVVRATNTCEQPELMGIPAAGVRQVFTATFTFQIEEGAVQQIWRNADDLGRLLQLGAQFSAGRPSDVPG